MEGSSQNFQMPQMRIKPLVLDKYKHIDDLLKHNYRGENEKTKWMAGSREIRKGLNKKHHRE